MKKNTRKKSIVHLLIGVCMLLTLSSCLKEDFTQTTDETPNIASFLKNSADYTMFYDAVKQAGAASYLDAWGTYTVFAPNNAAVQRYLQEQGKESLADFADEEIKLLVTQHIVEDTVSTGNFKDGKITKNSVAGLFITTSVVSEGGQAKIVLNKESTILLPNQRTGNGLVHGVDKVFTPITRTLVEQIQADPNLSLFAEALAATGLDVLLGKVAANEYFSVLTVTNEVFAQRGFHNLQDLKDKYSHTGNPRNTTDSLYMHMSYHIVKDLKYVSDLMLQSSHTTTVPNEIVLVKVDKERVLINEEEWLGTIELGAEVDRTKSDVTTKNGVLHYLKDNIFIKQRLPFPIYWDPANQPELKTAGIYKRASMSVPYNLIKDITLANTSNYYYGYPQTGNSAGAVNDDLLNFNLRTAVLPWVEMRTPVIVKGRYKVWIAWRRVESNQGPNMIDIYLNGVQLSRQLNTGEYRNTTLNPRELEAIGYKRVTTTGSNVHNCKMVGIIDIDFTDRHILRLETKTNRAAELQLDMIHFIPVDMEQIYPQFDANGNPVYPI
ncbi:DUF5108 domain-containing protein [Sphingobacterium olei]|uniref:DUF5108 domain-containing protein n=1 Tax=Sphingobacterium olei TaxID=2571155 RepID=A0A4U0P531_9SPHI|nr:fasciclin domain-containing protein [Sphingobacterium olei]TJZ61802.1 DUF5108 domain-containing protein [Sphingobacterium olei]